MQVLWGDVLGGSIAQSLYWEGCTEKVTFELGLETGAGVFPLKKEERDCRWREQHVQKQRGMEEQREELDNQWVWSIESVAGNGVRGGE